MDAHFDKLDRHLIQARRLRGHAKVIVDLRKAPVQSPDVAERIRIRTQHLYAADDRVAVIVDTPLLKMQMRRATGCDHIQNFISVEAAESWLATEP